MESTTHQVDKILHQGGGGGGIFFWLGGGIKLTRSLFFLFFSLNTPNPGISSGRAKNKQTNKQTNKKQQRNNNNNRSVLSGLLQRGFAIRILQCTAIIVRLDSLGNLTVYHSNKLIYSTKLIAFEVNFYHHFS